MLSTRVALLREVVIAVLFLAAVVAVTIGAAMYSPAAGWIVGGGLGAGWLLLVAGDVT